ncbi:MAG: YezD family protein [Planctomycetota bacterium]|nr:YezD family protein [Planctomycetota bacterium]
MSHITPSHITPEDPQVRTDALSESTLRQIAEVLKGLQFGVVSIIVQDGVVVQIERTEKHRLRKNERK